MKITREKGKLRKVRMGKEGNRKNETREREKTAGIIGIRTDRKQGKNKKEKGNNE